MKKTLLLFVMLCCATLAVAQQIDCRFTQDKTIKASGKVIHSEGVVSFNAPDNLTMTYTKPEGEYLIISGPMLRSNSQGQQISIDTSKNPRFRNMCNTLLNCIMGNCETAAQDNDAELAVSEKNGVKTAEMKARKAALRGYSKIIMEYRNNLPIRMVLEEFNGISTEYKFIY
ncbi:MAG: outer membrane lipoprotein carrier protein LolA [Bacteroidales bacterium]|nr:outer membrane lipoprotein carrier protein LolA [Bacteroidales bacterium]